VSGSTAFFVLRWADDVVVDNRAKASIKMYMYFIIACKGTK